MSDRPVYVIAHFTVFDAKQYRVYEKRFFGILKRCQGTFITYDDNAITLEGSDELDGRCVILQFPSEALAKAWYNDEEYQAISEYRRAGTTMQFMSMVHSLPER